MDKFHIAFYNEFNYLSILGLQLFYVSERGPWKLYIYNTVLIYVYQGTQTTNEGQTISNDSYWKEFFDWTIVILPDIGLYFLRNMA